MKSFNSWCVVGIPSNTPSEKTDIPFPISYIFLVTDGTSCSTSSHDYLHSPPYSYTHTHSHSYTHPHTNTLTYTHTATQPHTHLYTYSCAHLNSNNSTPHIHTTTTHTSTLNIHTQTYTRPSSFTLTQSVWVLFLSRTMITTAGIGVCDENI